MIARVCDIALFRTDMHVSVPVGLFVETCSLAILSLSRYCDCVGDCGHDCDCGCDSHCVCVSICL